MQMTVCTFIVIRLPVVATSLASLPFNNEYINQNIVGFHIYGVNTYIKLWLKLSNLPTKN